MEVSVAGRVLRLRDSGKLIFATLADRGADVQLFVSKGDVGDTAFADIKSLDRGDWVGARGRVMTTRAGEISVRVSELRCSPSRSARCPTNGTGCPTPTPATASATSTSWSTPRRAECSRCVTR